MSGLASKPYIGEENYNTEMYGSVMILVASWVAGGNLLMCALLYLNNLWTLINRILLAISIVSLFQVVLCILPAGISGIKKQWAFGDIWCKAYPYFYNFSQITILYLMVMLFVYRIYSMKNSIPCDKMLFSTKWVPITLFIFPYIVFTPPSLIMSASDDKVRYVQDKGLLYTCTTTHVPKNNVAMRSFEGLMNLSGFLIPYILFICIFIVTVYLIGQRKSNKAKVTTENMQEIPAKMQTKVMYIGFGDEESEDVDVLCTHTNAEQKVSCKSDRCTEFVIVIAGIILILSFTLLVHDKLRQIIDTNYLPTYRMIGLVLSYSTVFFIPIIYALQYPFIKQEILRMGHKTILKS